MGKTLKGAWVALSTVHAAGLAFLHPCPRPEREAHGPFRRTHRRLPVPGKLQKFREGRGWCPSVTGSGVAGPRCDAARLSGSGSAIHSCGFVGP